MLNYWSLLLLFLLIEEAHPMEQGFDAEDEEKDGRIDWELLIFGVGGWRVFVMMVTKLCPTIMEYGKIVISGEAYTYKCI